MLVVVRTVICVERASSQGCVRLSMENGRVLAPFALSCTRGSHRTIAHWTFEGIKVGRAPRPSRRLSSVAARRASPLDSALRVDLETTLGHRQLHPDVSHMRRVSPPRVSLYSILGCELKKSHSAPAASTSTHAVLVPLGWPEDDSQSERHHEGPYKRCRSGPGH